MVTRLVWIIGTLLLIGYFGISPAFAVPTLQLNIEGAKYYDSYLMDDGLGNTFTVTESWFTDKNPFILDVVGADSPKEVTRIGNVKLIMSVQSQFWQENGSISIKGVGADTSSVSKLITSSDFVYGSPDPFGDKNFPTHGIFPAYYFTLELPDLQVDNPTERESVYNYDVNYNPATSIAAALGDIQRYEIYYDSFYHVHFDLVGTAYGKKSWADGKNKFAPFSHDADAPPAPGAPVPEPGTFVLLGAGLAGLVWFRRRAAVS